MGFKSSHSCELSNAFGSNGLVICAIDKGRQLFLGDKGLRYPLADNGNGNELLLN